MTAIQNLQRIIGMRGTQAQIEAYTGILEEQVIAYATDIDSLGIFTNDAWLWFSRIPDITNIYAHVLFTRFEPLTNGDPASPELIFLNGDVVVTEVEN